MCVNEDEDGEDCCMLLFELGNSGRGGITVMSVALFIEVGVDEGTVVLLLIMEIIKSGMSFRLSG